MIRFREQDNQPVGKNPLNIRHLAAGTDPEEGTLWKVGRLDTDQGSWRVGMRGRAGATAGVDSS